MIAVGTRQIAKAIGHGFALGIVKLIVIELAPGFGGLSASQVAPNRLARRIAEIPTMIFLLNRVTRRGWARSSQWLLFGFFSHDCSPSFAERMRH